MRDMLLPLQFKINLEDPNDSDTVYLIIFSDLSFHSVIDIFCLPSLHKNLIHGNIVYLQFFLFLSSSSSSSKKLSSLEMEKNQFHVLAVDDNIIDRMVIERILLNSPSPSSSYYRVTVVDSGKKALEFLGLIGDDDDDDRRGHNGGVGVNLIMTDYSMPEMTGYELLRRIKEPSSYLKDVPVVMMSSENVPSRINMCLKDGADGFFLKPVKPSDVNGLIPQLLQINQTGTA